MADELDRVVPLDELNDFKVAEGDPDVRGWDVMSADGRKIGEVENLLVDTAAMKVRYLEVDVDREMLEASGERHILVPIGYARLDENADQVRVEALNSTDVRALPEYRREGLTREYETTVRQRFDAGFAPTSAETDLYGGTGYDPAGFYASRRGRQELSGPRDVRPETRRDL